MDELQNIIEIWKVVEGITTYEVSNMGRVRRINTGRIMKFKIDRYGYPALTLHDNGKPRYKTVHFLVCTAFHGAKPTPGHTVNHIDGVKTNNHESNHEWVTVARNIEHAREIGLRKNIQDYYPPPKGVDNCFAKITDQDVRDIRRFPKSWGNTAIAEFYPISDTNICHIRKGRAWKHVT